MEGEEVWKWAFCFSRFETTEICLGCTKMENSTGKKHAGKKSEKVTLTIWKIFPLRYCMIACVFSVMMRLDESVQKCMLSLLSA